VGEIENIIPDYTHQSQTVVARSSRPHPVGRLADNGLSASSTSTATSSPDGKAPVAPVSANQLSSRMDTFAVDTPLASLSPAYPPVGGPSSAAYSYGSGHYGGGGGGGALDVPATSGLVLMRQSASSPADSSTTVPASNLHYSQTQTSLRVGAKQAANEASFSKRQQLGYQQRSGQQAPSPKSSSDANSSKRYQNQQQSHLYAIPGASTIAHSSLQLASATSKSGNNLLTSISTNQPVTIKAKRQQTQQQLYENNRITSSKPVDFDQNENYRISNKNHSNQKANSHSNFQNNNNNHNNAEQSTFKRNKLYNSNSHKTTRAS